MTDLQQAIEWLAKRVGTSIEHYMVNTGRRAIGINGALTDAEAWMVETWLIEGGCMVQKYKALTEKDTFLPFIQVTAGGSGDYGMSHGDTLNEALAAAVVQLWKAEVG